MSHHPKLNSTMKNHGKYIFNRSTEIKNPFILSFYIENKLLSRNANASLFSFNGQYLGEYDNHDHSQGGFTAMVALDFSTFKPNEQYLFEILSISLGIDNGVWSGGFEYKGIVGNVWIKDQLIVNDTTNPWKHKKGLVGEYFQIYTQEGSSKFDWNNQWTKGIDKPITWFQATFDLGHLVKEDVNANPILLDAQGLSRGHAFINGNDLGLYWLIQGFCHDATPCCCQQAQINCFEPTQRYYHILSDWLMPTNNLITIFDVILSCKSYMKLYNFSKEKQSTLIK